MAKEYDLVIIGGGTGGYVAAIRASQLGLKTAIVEKNKLGGTCLHQGCIPTKTLLKSAEVYRTMKESSDYGVLTKVEKLDFAKVQKRKSEITEQLYQGVQMLIKKNKIDVYNGIGRIMGPSIFSPLPGTVSVESDTNQENEMLIPKFVLLATGSKPRELPSLPFNKNNILSSDDMLQLDHLPESIIIVGGGVIGLEWASMLADFDVQVTIVEASNRLAPHEDEEISKEITQVFRKKGIQILTKAMITDSLEKDNQITVTVKQNGKKTEFTAEKMLVSVGRAANTEGIGLENTDIDINNGFIQVNEFYQTKESHIYAIGDCIGGMQLAHVAAREGTIAVEHMANQDPEPLNYHHVPKCTYSFPEIASIGMTEKEAKNKNFELKIGRFPFKAIGKALITGHPSGFVKLIADAKTNDLLGIHMIGPHVTDLISEASLAFVLDATPDEMAYTIHPHPTLSEIFSEASLMAEGRPIHL